MKTSNHPPNHFYVYFLLLLLCVFLNSCVSNPVSNESDSIQSKESNRKIQNPEIDFIETELMRAYEYKDIALSKVEAIKKLIDKIIPVIDVCKTPRNALTPFLFSNTTIVPSDTLYRQHSLEPCDFFRIDSEIASNNVSNHLNYIDSILTEIVNVNEQIQEDCRDNGMSDYYKALVKNSMLAFRSIVHDELSRIDGFINDVTNFLTGFEKCIES